MPQPMTPAPPASTAPLTAVDAVVRLLRGLGQGVVEPVMGYPTDPWGQGTRAALATVKSMLPWRGTYGEERQKLKEQDEARWPGITSVVPEVQKEAQIRAIKGDAAGQVQPAMIIGHASPRKWTGRPKWTESLSGQGAATWGPAAAYASVPENFGSLVAPASEYEALMRIMRENSTVTSVPPREWFEASKKLHDLQLLRPRGIDTAYRKQLLEAAGEYPFTAELKFDPSLGEVPERVQRLLRGWAIRQADAKSFLHPEMFRGVSPLDLIDDKAESVAGHLRDMMRTRRQGDPEFRPTLNEVRHQINILRGIRGLRDVQITPAGSFHVWNLPDDAKIINQFDLLEQHPDLVNALSYGDPHVAKLIAPENSRVMGAMEAHPAKTAGALTDLGYDATKYYGEQNYSYNNENPVQNYTILNPDKIEPLGTFNSALEFWQSGLAEDLWPQIQKEMAERLRERRLLFGPEAK